MTETHRQNGCTCPGTSPPRKDLSASTTSLSWFAHRVQTLLSSMLSQRLNRSFAAGWALLLAAWTICCSRSSCCVHRFSSGLRTAYAWCEIQGRLRRGPHAPTSDGGVARRSSVWLALRTLETTKPAVGGLGNGAALADYFGGL